MTSGSGITEKDREAVEAVRQLLADNHDGVTSAQLAEQMGIGKGTASYRVRRLLNKGYLENLSKDRNRMQLILGDPLPEESSLPNAEWVMQRYMRSSAFVTADSQQEDAGTADTAAL